MNTKEENIWVEKKNLRKNRDRKKLNLKLKKQRIVERSYLICKKIQISKKYLEFKDKNSKFKDIKIV